MKLYISITYGQGEKEITKHFNLSKSIFFCFDLKMPILQKPWFVKFVTIMTIHICSKYPTDIYEKDTC
jgi:hypothetical protein